MTDLREVWFQTFTGRRFHPLAPRVDEIAIEDIAHALSQMCRWNGHSRVFYSVAEHSVRVANLLNYGTALADEDRRPFALAGLLHDAAEAYLVDLPRPVKRHALFASFRTAEAVLQAAIAERFGIAFPMPADVRVADEVLLATEARDLMGSPSWCHPLEKLTEPIEPWSAVEAERIFLRRFADLTSPVAACPDEVLGDRAASSISGAIVDHLRKVGAL